MKKHLKRKIIRLKDYDYSRSGYYFVTICTYNRVCLFGKITNNTMMLNQAGKMIHFVLTNIPHYNPGLLLDAYVIMPNHIHAIIIINKNEKSLNNGQTQWSVPTNISISKIFQRMKMLTTKLYIDGVKNKGWLLFNTNLWQRSFHDHIIRNEQSLQKIREYIQNNPSTWSDDQENPKIEKTSVGADHCVCPPN